jgi:hypothetical protein
MHDIDRMRSRVELRLGSSQLVGLALGTTLFSALLFAAGFMIGKGQAPTVAPAPNLSRLLDASSEEAEAPKPVTAAMGEVEFLFPNALSERPTVKKRRRRVMRLPTATLVGLTDEDQPPAVGSAMGRKEKAGSPKVAAIITAAKQRPAPLQKKSTKPAVKPVAKRADKPTQKTATKPAVKPVAQRADKPTQKTATKPAVKPVAQRADKPTQKTATKPVVKPIAKRADPVAAKPTQKTTTKPAAAKPVPRVVVAKGKGVEARNGHMLSVRAAHFRTAKVRSSVSTKKIGGTGKVKPTIAKTATSSRDSRTRRQTNIGRARFTLQVKATRDKAVADKFVEVLQKAGFYPHRILISLPRKGRFYRIRVGRFETIEEARAFQRSYSERSGMPDGGFVTRL